MKLKDRVRALLESQPELRDNCQAMLAELWRYDLMDTKTVGLNSLYFTAEELLVRLSEGKLTNARSACRWWSKIQEAHHELRGKLYNQRHGLEAGVIAELQRETPYSQPDRFHATN